MDPSSLDFSIFDSTSILLSFLDLNEYHQQMMHGMDDDMEIDMVMEVPDTPDRLAARRINNSGEDTKVNSDLSDKGVSNRERERRQLTIGNGNNRRFYSRPRVDSSFRDEFKKNGHSIVTVTDSPSVSKNARLYKRIMAEKGSSTQPQFTEHVSSGNDRAKLDGYTLSTAEILASDEVHDRNKEKNRTYMRNKMMLRGNTSSNTDGCSNNNAVSGVDRGKGIDFSSDTKQNAEHMISRSLQSNSSPRFNGQKRLVRNGCISPYNIQRAKQTAESQDKISTDDKPVDIEKVMSQCWIPSSQGIIISPRSESNETNAVERVKGKGVMEESVLVKEFDTKAVHLSNRGSLYHTEDANGIEDASRNLDVLGGWRCTRNRSKKTSLALSDKTEHLSGRSDGVGHFLDKNRMESIDRMTRLNTSPGSDFLEVRNPVSFQPGSVPCSAQVSSSFIADLERENGQHCGANKIPKRQRKRASARSNLGESSASPSHDKEVTYVWSSGEPSDVRSTGNQTTNHRGMSAPVIVIDEFSPEVRCRRSQDTSQMVNDDYSDVRARQVEADEMLARQLQEQFYDESQVVGGGEIDANIAWTLQQEEDTQRAASVARQRVHPRDSSMSHLYRQYPPRSSQNSVVRSANRSRVPTSTRMAQLRSSFLSRSPAAVSARGRSSRFPSNMDIEMRIHILEALEAAVGDSDDMRASHLFQVQREFNENDYEMLLALDQNNHQQGASINQINNLPESIVQTDNNEEACAICLEAPTTGDTVRHLPCLHKFHKDCIDPWLRTKTSCPICKSSIT